jgi:type II secretory pathway pseudopilin PulG
MLRLKQFQAGIAAWVMLLLLSAMAGLLLQAAFQQQPRQAAMQKTMAALALAQQALLAYAYQPLLTTTPCGKNCPRPGDLPCPDRNNDGIAEGNCSKTSRLGRLPWRTLGLGDIRDGSGERLWYAVSDRYKNNPRVLPLNMDTPGSWTVRAQNGMLWDATQGSGVVAVIIAPMQPLLRKDGWLQQRDALSSEEVRHYLDLSGLGDNASPLEHAAQGFVQAPASVFFNDVVWPVTASLMHKRMQQQVLSELKRAFRCTNHVCAGLPLSAAIADRSCLGEQSLSAGQCLPATSGLGRLPVAADAQWPLALQQMLDGDAMHHWFQQNGWREQVFYQPGPQRATLVVAGEKLAPQMRITETDKSSFAAYLEASTLQKLHITDANALDILSNDSMEP